MNTKYAIFIDLKRVAFAPTKKLMISSRMSSFKNLFFFKKNKNF